MVASVRVVDEHFGVEAPVRRAACELRLASERVTPREIIRRRVEAEVEDLNRAKTAQAEGRTRSFLVPVEDNSGEARLNEVLPSAGYRLHLFNVENEVARAQAAFEKRSFIMLFDDRQIDDADQEVALTPESEIVFVYLTPLRGG